jgi:threonine 3-dehydrogenase
MAAPRRQALRRAGGLALAPHRVQDTGSFSTIVNNTASTPMDALVKREAAPGLNLESVPEPAVGINDVLIRVRRTAICGTDMHIYNWDAWARKTIPVPMIVGHEFVGEIVEVGSNVNDFRPGQIVSGEGHVVCGRCRNCMAGRRHLCAHTSGIGVNRPGAFAEYVALPMSNVWEHRPGIDLDVAALFDPLGNAVHTALQYDLLGEDVLITGAGPIGAMAAAVCRHAGARHVVITDVIDERLALAARLGATRTVNVTREKLADVQAELGMQEGFDVGLEMSGNSAAFNDLIASMCHGGKIAMLGIPGENTAIDWNTVIFNMLTLKGIYGREMYETWYKMSVMVQSGLDVSPVITHRMDYRDYEDGFAAMNAGKASKVILNWDGER